MPNKTGQGERKDRDNRQQAGQGKRNDRGNQQQAGRDKNKDQRSSPTPQRKEGQDNPGNFGNDPKRASEAGRKGGRS
jgi:general stress protein YciG